MSNLAMIIIGSTLAAAKLPGVFVSVSHGGFELSNEPLKFGGTNNLELQLLDNYSVDDAISRAAANNGTVLRIWAFSDGSWCPTASEPPQYPFYQCWDNETQQVWTNETAFSAHLDYVISSASRNGVKLVLALVNNWSAYGGFSSYLWWRSQLPGAPAQQYHGDFYTDALIRGFYKSWVSTVLNRVNSITGIAYKDDPAIMSWELGNELGCGGEAEPYPQGPTCVVNGTSNAMAAWIDEMATYIKTVDQNHLVTIGDCGFYGENNTGGFPCPGNQWWCNGQSGDWLRNLAIPSVDYGTFHVYPDMYHMDEWIDGQSQFDVTRNWVGNHTSQAHALGKPLVMEEFGYVTNNATGALITQHEAYGNFTAFAADAGLDGWNVWMWAGVWDSPSGLGPFEKSQWPSFWRGGDAGLQVYCLAEGDPTPPLDTDHDILSCPILSAAAGALMSREQHGHLQTHHDSLMIPV